MAGTAPTPAAPADTVFRFFNKEQGKNYAQYRLNYHSRLYQTIVDRHTSTGGQLTTLLDVGCGPGTAVRTLAPLFEHAIGIDPSHGMINTALSMTDAGDATKLEPIRFEISQAEELGSNLSPPIADGSVDLITAATSAHHFDMAGFWTRAAQVLKPGGTVALWCSGSLTVDPSMPNFACMQVALDSHEELLKDHTGAGSLLTRNLYRDLPLPWTLATPVPEFDETTSFRKEWGTGGDSEPGNEFFSHQPPADMDTLEKMLGTTGSVARWRKANPDAVGTERDVARIIRRRVEKCFREAGVEAGKELLKGGVAGVLLIVKKK
ncbi:methyltransferase domain-containing protein [Rhizodiscina lignyota]|uniref:Methyltransferase domain-containing protein n=1 Tax=Rhizodiscina lignyota TaxID=1504668 RepID=A0A9P4MD72_9PEZI|nr:methyltransferase domain-containing protein [Rhizodiscina lignyota]